MKPNAQTVLTAAVVFALAMGALEHGGWWWLWFGAAAWLVIIGSRLPLFGRVKISAANRYILRENRKVRRENRANARRRRRLNREKLRNSKRSRATPV
jgi:hypothetical protein